MSIGHLQTLHFAFWRSFRSSSNQSLKSANSSHFWLKTHFPPGILEDHVVNLMKELQQQLEGFPEAQAESTGPTRKPRWPSEIPVRRINSLAIVAKLVTSLDCLSNDTIDSEVRTYEIFWSFRSFFLCKNTHTDVFWCRFAIFLAIFRNSRSPKKLQGPIL